jgi:hypothetical protein
MAAPRFEVVEEPESRPEPESHAAFSVLMLALKGLSQRALIAISDLFLLFTVFGTWWLWHSIPDPNTNQIAALSIFAIFVLAANFIQRRK